MALLPGLKRLPLKALLAAIAALRAWLKRRRE